jgi:formylglycine-generating enzyme required for sulfatase activity
LKISTFPNLSIIWYCAYLSVGCSDKVNTFNRADLDAFLSQYDPAMKTKRNELVQNLALNREQVAKLNGLKNSFKYEKTQRFVGKQAQALQVQGQGLERLLNEIDASIEISVAAKEMNLADAGGLKSSESQELLKQAEMLIQQSKALSDDVGMLFSAKQTEDPIPRTNDTSEDARSTPPNSSGGDFKRAAQSTQSLALVPAGSFSMGDGMDGMEDAPVHTVVVSAFYIGKTEVTKGEWDAVRDWAVSHGYADLSAGAGKAPTHPVHTITWWDAVKWCNARSEREGLVPCYAVGGSPMRVGTEVPEVNWSAKGYRLPTEAEWEKAARGGLRGKRFPWGDTMSHKQVNYHSSRDTAYDVSPTRGCHPRYLAGAEPNTSPAGNFTANGYGLHDVAGNVWEWCWDWPGVYSGGVQSDPRGATSGTNRVYRGGSWLSSASYCRTAYRAYNNPGVQNGYLGFRVLRSSAP